MNVIAVLSRFTRNSTIGALKQIQVTVFSQRSLTGQTDKTDPKAKTDSTNQKNDSKSSRSSNTTEEPPNDQQYDENVRRTILSASLPYVLELGWSKEALVKGAESLGYPGVSHGLFPRGGAELVQYFYTDCNQKLAVKLKKDVEESKKIVPSVFIQGAVQTRLRMIVPYISRWPQAIAIMSLPPNVPHTLANLLTLVDDICYYAGDRSVDFTWYSRRIALGGVYKASELYLIQDKSEDNKDTWEFVTRRLDELFQIQTLISQSDNFTEHAKESITSAFITARNILGINWNR